jgi:hypothetical protein
MGDCNSVVGDKTSQYCWSVWTGKEELERLNAH